MSLAINPNDKLISFIGKLDSALETELITQVEKCLETLHCSEDEQQKIISMTVELLQNILHHSSTTPPGDNITESMFQLEKTKKGFVISTSNFMKTKKNMLLQKRIEYLNSLTLQELANLYKDILNNGQSARETAGLGLIDIRRKSRNPILFKFAPVNTDYSLVTVKVHV